MKVRFLRLQKYNTSDLESNKIFYTANATKENNSFETDDGAKATMHVFGEKELFLKCDSTVMNELIQQFKSNELKAGTIVDFKLEPNPLNPAMNICSGIIKLNDK